MAPVDDPAACRSAGIRGVRVEVTPAGSAPGGDGLRPDVAPRRVIARREPAEGAARAPRAPVAKAEAHDHAGRLRARVGHMPRAG